MSFNSSTDLPALPAPRRKRSLWRRMNEVEDRVDAGPVSVRRLLTSEELLALADGPITLVEAPESGFVVLPLQISLSYVAGETPYVDDGAVMELQTDNGTRIAVIDNLGGLVTEPEDKINVITLNDAQGASANFNGRAVHFVLDVSPTEGDGTLMIDLLYRIVAL